ncbi:hypothetical protein PHYBLDRAFT_170084 [Phycomyces blakesleeanus NRRL 1555(-)]|uniref:Uncharacterized protein n=1 Tax=Phycomyces blakesleeanus (strain ATCC 8743b / DSM 1359 / FGSC 10004 / NBRC 33097 / NRRL 1555) TaxID=763407 RepID=A0A167M9D9_PHYB8|nr:hypothetical protein PHYBLDRAFT_170084 [Phycomyces blakesleeanus NRRL 1555(-)]OAD72187.1 hypothetical protein PHYBLDRAFT_170084 [Phycomyces blakesleeanus NRRL 1555(-)]|eukprot:XP_018290227.1 hypothetical protein PHYBLDRAFT_170084 [Phycomyces blakesleeanus NRRL 1555(-)]
MVSMDIVYPPWFSFSINSTSALPKYSGTQITCEWELKISIIYHGAEDQYSNDGRVHIWYNPFFVLHSLSTASPKYKTHQRDYVTERLDHQYMARISQEKIKNQFMDESKV